MIAIIKYVTRFDQRVFYKILTQEKDVEIIKDDMFGEIKIRIRNDEDLRNLLYLLNDHSNYGVTLVKKWTPLLERWKNRKCKNDNKSS